VPPAQRDSVQAAVNAVKSGPLGANGVPATVPGPKGTLVTRGRLAGRGWSGGGNRRASYDAVLYVVPRHQWGHKRRS
jgi:hypothetical protein